MTMNVLVPTTFGDPFVITLSGISSAFPVVTLWRMGQAVELVQGTPLVLDVSGGGVIYDALYPLAGPFGYSLRDGTGTFLMDYAGPFDPPVPTGDEAGKPQVMDVITPGLRSAMEVIDVTGRLRAGRVSVYSTIGVRGYTTVGDARLLSSGTLGVLFRSHAERDRILAALSTGGPCVLRVPAGCQVKLDEMWFTPLDVAEERVGRTGAGTLSIDFVEVEAAPARPLPPSTRAVTYAEQTTNAASAGQTYADMSLVFTGYTYTDMSLSRTGIAP